MSTLIGHSLAATVITSAVPKCTARRPRVLLVAAVLAGILPDCDVLVAAFLRPGSTGHRGLSHSLVFALAASAVLAVAIHRVAGIRFIRAWVVLALAAMSHPVLDYLMGAGPPVPFFAPFSDRGHLAPVRLLPTAYYATSLAPWLTARMLVLNGFAAVLEVLLFAPWLVITSRASSARAKVGALVLVFFAAVITFNVYSRTP
jgi:inner membrane protein